MIRYGDDLIYGGVGLIIAALVVFFYPALVKKLGVPRMIIGLFFVLLCVVALLYDLSLSGLMSNTLVRMGMNSILVLRDGARHPVRHRAQPRPADRHRRRFDRRPAGHRVAGGRLAGLRARVRGRHGDPPRQRRASTACCSTA